MKGWARNIERHVCNVGRSYRKRNGKRKKEEKYEKKEGAGDGKKRAGKKQEPQRKEVERGKVAIDIKWIENEPRQSLP